MFDHTTNADDPARPMTDQDTTHAELDESPTTDTRYAHVTTEDGVVLYDRDNESAWIESDTTCTPREMV